MRISKISGEFGPRKSGVEYKISNSEDIRSINLSQRLEGSEVSLSLNFYKECSQIQPLYRTLKQFDLIEAYNISFFRYFLFTFNPNNEQKIPDFKKFVCIIDNLYTLPQEVLLGIKEYFGIDLKTPSLLDLCLEKICDDQTWVEKYVGDNDLPSDLKMRIADHFESQSNNANAPSIGM